MLRLRNWAYKCRPYIYKVRERSGKLQGVVCLLLILLWAGCAKQPQPVRHLHDKQEPDSAMMAQMRFNMHMADAADRACQQAVGADSLRYTLDDFGFWYAKTLRTTGDTLRTGQQLTIHLVMSELSGKTIADVQDLFTIGSGDLPTAINRSLTQMCMGEQMTIIAPWYTAYGIEGTALIKPYTNLRIILTTQP